MIDFVIRGTAAAAMLIAGTVVLAAEQPAATGPSTGEKCVSGKFVAEGVECAAFRGDDGRLYSLPGVAADKPTSRDATCVCGRPVLASTCMQGIPLADSRIAEPAACQTR